MQNSSAYDAIKIWASKLKIDLKDTSDPAERLTQLAHAVAALRLKQMDSPPEPDSKAVQELLWSFFESRVQEAAATQVAARENQPYFGCHRTPDSRPPHAPLP